MLPATNPSDRAGLNLILRQAVNLLNSIEALQSTAVEDGTLEFVNELHLRAEGMRLDVNSKLGKKVTIIDTTIRRAVYLWGIDRSTAIKIYGHISEWDTSRVTDMSGLFYDYEAEENEEDPGVDEFDDDISNWNVSSVRDFSSMFEDAQWFNQNLSKWNTKRATNMESMFMRAESFNGDISGWNVSNVQNFSWMFTKVPIDRDLSQWNTSNATDISYMFYGAERFNSDVSKWNISKVKTFDYMFGGGNNPNCTTSFNHDLVDWLYMALSEPCLNASTLRELLALVDRFSPDLSSDRREGDGMSVLHVAAQTVYTHHCDGDTSRTIIQVLIETLGQNTASSRDGRGRLPLEYALRSKKDSVDTGCLIDAYPACLGTRTSTGLHWFVHASLNKDSSVDTLYRLLRGSPELQVAPPPAKSYNFRKRPRTDGPPYSIEM
jgi:surface protein